MAVVDGKIKCPKCGQKKPLGDFAPSAVRKGSGSCRPCMTTYQREWARRDPSKPAAATSRWWSKKTSEEKTAYGRARRASGRLVFYRYKAKYGIKQQDYLRLLEQQGGVCAVCAGPPKAGRRLHVDHDHRTGAVRGLLCQHCNSGLGMFDDDIKRLQGAVAYLQRSTPCLSVVGV